MTKTQENKACAAEQTLHKLKAREDAYEPIRMALLSEALKSVPFDGWTPLMVARAGNSAGISSSDIKLAFPNGVIDLIDYWAEDTDRHMLMTMSGDDFKTLKIREKVTAAIRYRLEHLAPHHEAARRAAATLALPHNAHRAIQLSWRIADHIWRGLGDTSTDYNYYSKRTILSGVWTTTFAKWLADESEAHRATWDFLDKRIANVMSFEKIKADLIKRDINPLDIVSKRAIPFLAKLRYPSFR